MSKLNRPGVGHISRCSEAFDLFERTIGSITVKRLLGDRTLLSRSNGSKCVHYALSSYIDYHLGYKERISSNIVFVP